MIAASIDDLRAAARRRLPRAIFDFIDGGAHAETTLRANRAAWDRHAFAPRTLVDVSTRTLATTVLGDRLDLPFLLAPVGLAGLFAREGELAAARAAEAAGTVSCLSTTAVASIEAVRGVTTKPFWFQLYALKDRGVTRELIARARAAGCSVLVFTVDLPVQGQRDRDVRNGFTMPPRVTVANAFDTLRRFGWLRDVLLGPRPTFGNLAGRLAEPEPFVTIAAHIARQFDASMTWSDLEWIREAWGGPLALKGILTVDDARRAADHGVNGIVVSNHGGRQLDGAPATLEVLPEIVDAVGDRIEVLFDGGIRRGQDVVKALALGARACLIGRAWAWGVAAGGEAGVARSIEILRREIDSTLALLGHTSVASLDRSVLRPVQRA